MAMCLITIRWMITYLGEATLPVLCLPGFFFFFFFFARLNSKCKFYVVRVQLWKGPPPLEQFSLVKMAEKLEVYSFSSSEGTLSVILQCIYNK